MKYWYKKTFKGNKYFFYIVFAKLQDFSRSEDFHGNSPGNVGTSKELTRFRLVFD